MSADGVVAERGLGPELFHFVSSLTPIINVDLLVYNRKGQILLSRRDDPYCGIGWHIPGGCIRFKETFESRIRKVAEEELGLSDFTFDKEPIKVFEIKWNMDRQELENQNERAHFITLVFKCQASCNYQINNKGKQESEAGYLQWFDKLPDDLLSIQNCYRQILK